MTSLTTYFPPVTAGDFYTPAMMEYDGSTGYYSSTITTSGNKITLIARFKILPETGNGYQTIAWCAGSTPRTRLAFYAGDTDIADTTHRNKLVMYGTDSSGTVTCRLVSTIDVNDGNTYTAFGSYDGDTGAATFYINGADVDDVGTGGRVLTTGTLEAGASSVFYTGAAGSANWKNGGEIGYVGMAEVYLTNWSDFMDPQGNPKDIEDNPSTVWGGTPLFWNQYGDMENNLGSAGAMTRNGSIVVSDDGTTGSSYALSATAVEADIASGKTAWVNGQKVTGTVILPTSGEDGLIDLGLLNGNCVSNDTSNWTQDVNTFTTRATNPYEGGYYFMGGTTAEAEMHQDVDPIVSPITSTMIDAGQVIALLAWQQSSYNSMDEANCNLAFYDNGMSLISTAESTSISIPATNAVPWVGRSVYAVMPPGTRTVRVIAKTYRNEGTNCDGYLDVITVYGLIL